MKSFPYALRAQIACYELKGDLSPVIFHDSFEIFEIYKDLYGKPCKRDCHFGVAEAKQRDYISATVHEK